MILLSLFSSSSFFCMSLINFRTYLSSCGCFLMYVVKIGRRYLLSLKDFKENINLLSINFPKLFFECFTYLINLIGKPL
jgi:hypothetical protein